MTQRTPVGVSFREPLGTNLRLAVALLFACAPQSCANQREPVTTWSGKPLVLCAAELAQVDMESPWDEYADDEPISGHGVAPLAAFRILEPEEYRGRTFDVLFKCWKHEQLTPPLPDGMNAKYELRLPKDFLDGGFREIEDCDFPIES